MLNYITSRRPKSGKEFKELRLKAEELIRGVLPHFEPPELAAVLEEMTGLALARAKFPFPKRPAPRLKPVLPGALDVENLFPPDYIALKLSGNNQIAALQRKIAAIPSRKSRYLRRKLEEELVIFRSKLATKLDRIHFLGLSAEQRISAQRMFEEQPELQVQVETWYDSIEKDQLSHQQEVERWELQALDEIARVQLRIIERLRSDAARARSGQTDDSAVTLVRVAWRLLPPPEPGTLGLTRLLTGIAASFPQLRFNEERLKYAYSLNPERIYIGSGEFDGYLAFQFAWTSRTLLECPMDGNAAYIFSDEWRTLSRLSKTELLREFRGRVGRVIHNCSRNWKQEIESCLGPRA
jgi:hypothetical protein